MDAAQPDLLHAIKQRLAWLGQRQAILARNVANADTPDYRPRDLRPFAPSAPSATTGKLPAPVAMTATEPGHLPGRRRAGGYAEQVERNPYETAPAGNAVVLEEQMAKLNQTAISHRLASELYRKHLAMINTAIGRR